MQHAKNIWWYWSIRFLTLTKYHRDEWLLKKMIKFREQSVFLTVYTLCGTSRGAESHKNPNISAESLHLFQIHELKFGRLVCYATFFTVQKVCVPKNCQPLYNHWQEQELMYVMCIIPCNKVFYDGTGYKRRTLTQPLKSEKNQTRELV